MPPALVYYISGHGWGHARRCAEVVRAFRAIRPDVTVYLRTTAAPAALADVVGPGVEHHPVALDPGAVEDDTLAVNPARTLAAVQASVDTFRPRLHEEVRFLRDARVTLVLADAPFLAGDVAAAAGVPCVAVTNFTWDWIYEPFLADHPRYARLLDSIRASYGRMRALLRLPWGGACEDRFAEVIDCPLVANSPRLARADVLARLGIGEGDARPRILIGLRGGMPADALARAAAQSPDYLFLCPQDLPAGSPANLVPVAAGGPLAFADLVAASAAVVSKLGYGIIADCIAARVPILWPDRRHFREDAVSRVAAAPFLNHREIALDALRAGDWRPDLADLLAAPSPPQIARTDGAEFVAAEVSRRLG